MFRIDFNKLRFLVCDDNPHMRRILRTLLHSFGAREVYESEDGATALEMYTHYVPDIVITDWAMPIFDGLELAQMIRQPESKGNPYAPIIMLTGHSEKRRVTVARDAGVTEFLAKPISAKGLYQRILNVVANPRPFIKTKTYFGPDRRRNTNNAYIGPERRVGGEMEVMQQPSLLDKARSSHLAKRSGKLSWRKTSPRDRDQDLRRSSRDHAAQSAAQGAAAGRRRGSRRSRGARGEGAGRPVGRIQELDDGRKPTGSPRPTPRSSRTASPTPPARELFRAAHDIKGDAATFGYPSAGVRRRKPVPDHRARARPRRRCRRS